MVFGFGLSRSFCLHFRNCSNGIPLEFLHSKDIRKVLTHLARDVCYKLVRESKSAKISSNLKGSFDFDLSNLFRKKSSLQVETRTNFLQPLSLTSSKSGVPSPVIALKLRDLLMMTNAGSVASRKKPCIIWSRSHPYEVAMLRLRCFTTFPCTSAFEADRELVEYWTDGSLLWADVFWLTTAAFSVIDVIGNVVETGPVFHFSLSSHAAELWGVIMACWSVCTDSETVVKFCAQIQVRGIPQNVSHRTWWLWIVGIWRERRAFHPDHRLVWVPSHLLPHVPTADLTDELAVRAGSTRQHCVEPYCRPSCPKRLLWKRALPGCADPPKVGKVDTNELFVGAENCGTRLCC